MAGPKNSGRLAIRAETHVAGRMQLHQLATRRGMPQTKDVIPGNRDEQFAPGMEAEHGDLLSVTFQNGHLPPGFNVPDLNSRVRACDGKVFAIGVPRNDFFGTWA